MIPTLRRIGVFTSGGDGPGMNAAIRAVVRTAVYNGIEVVGILSGYEGLIRNEMRPFGARDVSNILQHGGTILRTARSEGFRRPEGRTVAAANLRAAGIDALVAIGGDGTFAGALLLEKEHDVAVIGVPGTIDNDLRGTDLTIGFDTAVNTAVGAIDRIRDTASSHDRLFFVEVMGRHSGLIALHCALATGAEYVMVPERPQSMEELATVLLAGAARRSSSIVIVAEGDEEGGAFAVAKKLKEHTDRFDIRVSVLGHMQRGGSPTVTDRILGARLGIAAVQALMEGRRGSMAGIQNDTVSLTRFEEVIAARKELRPELLHALAVLSI
ncbi:MAG: 6-phosphofructokinase [Flavobacteriales bacterium]|nr:6-phosphofructokinase [Flavobacteriales bacterium]